MTKALEDAFKAASRLPDKEQDALAAAILDEIRVEKKWDATLAASPSALEKLADEALADHRAGRTELLDPEKL
jgi:hypothetical protein